MIHFVFLQKPSTGMAGLAGDESIPSPESCLRLQAGQRGGWGWWLLGSGVLPAGSGAL